MREREREKEMERERERKSERSRLGYFKTRTTKVIKREGKMKL